MSKPIAFPQDTSVVTDTGKLTPHWHVAIDRLIKQVNDLQVRVMKLETKVP